MMSNTSIIFLPQIINSFYNNNLVGKTTIWSSILIQRRMELVFVETTINVILYFWVSVETKL